MFANVTADPASRSRRFLEAASGSQTETGSECSFEKAAQQSHSIPRPVGEGQPMAERAIFRLRDFKFCTSTEQPGIAQGLLVRQRIRRSNSPSKRAWRMSSQAEQGQPRCAPRFVVEPFWPHGQGRSGSNQSKESDLPVSEPPFFFYLRRTQLKFMLAQIVVAQ